jgi:hypothetical protein
VGGEVGKVGKVIISDQLEPAQRIKVASHELAHIRCDHHQPGARAGEDLHRGRKETEAESVAHIVCLALGLHSSRTPTPTSCAGRMATWT